MPGAPNAGGMHVSGQLQQARSTRARTTGRADDGSGSGNNESDQEWDDDDDEQEEEGEEKAEGEEKLRERRRHQTESGGDATDRHAETSSTSSSGPPSSPRQSDNLPRRNVSPAPVSPVRAMLVTKEVKCLWCVKALWEGEVGAGPTVSSLLCIDWFLKSSATVGTKTHCAHAMHTRGTGTWETQNINRCCTAKTNTKSRAHTHRKTHR